MSTVKGNQSELPPIAAEAQFVEDDQLVHITARGQDSEYLSDEEEMPLDDDDTENEDQPMEEEQMSEVTFNMRQGSTNNNATLATPMTGDRVQASRIDENDKKEIIGEAIGQAVAQVKDLIANSGFLETASMLQAQLKKQEQHFEQQYNRESTLERDARIKKKDDPKGRKGLNFNLPNNEKQFDCQSSEVTVYRKCRN